MRQQKLCRRAVVAVAAAATLAALAGGCSGDSGTEPLQVFVTAFADPPSISVTGSSTITAEVRTSNGNGGAGWRLQYSSTAGALFVTGAGSVTDANGVARVTLRGDGVPGVAVVTVRIVDRSEQAQAQVRIGLD